ncbi:MAG: prepilin-type N-terminal cleavage/methylation domain-containing protein [Heliobacteriaceae bacterium]|nr:prepilin-type N-terminal cleavage/methylation domain-containing protein [Heliobacteriaceae bacterium]
MFKKVSSCLLWNEREKGLTLTEVMTVLVILGILFCCGAPVLSNWYSAVCLEVATRQVQSDLLWARDRSVQEKVNYATSFFPAINEYQIRRTVDGRVVRRGCLPAGIAVVTTTFNPYTGLAHDFTWATDGRAGLPGMGGTVALRDQRGKFRFVIVSRNGRVRVAASPPGGTE